MATVMNVAQLERAADFISACPKPRKVEFRSAAKARKRARQLGMGFYKCVCGSWHLTRACLDRSWIPVDIDDDICDRDDW